MPTYTHEVEAAPMSEAIDRPVNPTMPIHLPISKEMAESMTVGDQVTVEFKATVKEIDAGYDDSPESHSMRVETSKVKMSNENEYERMAREDEED